MPLHLDVPGEATINNDNSITYGPSTHLELEHSLISISKWEAKYHKPFLTKDQKTPEEMADYIRFMVITKVKDLSVFDRLSQENIIQIQNYINDPMSATTIKSVPGHRKANNGSVVTSELVYYWLTALNIPFEVEKWHFNRLMKLVEVASEKNQPKKKMPKKEVLRKQSALNEARRKASGSAG